MSALNVEMPKYVTLNLSATTDGMEHKDEGVRCFWMATVLYEMLPANKQQANNCRAHIYPQTTVDQRRQWRNTRWNTLPCCHAMVGLAHCEIMRPNEEMSFASRRGERCRAQRLTKSCHGRCRLRVPRRDVEENDTYVAGIISSALGNHFCSYPFRHALRGGAIVVLDLIPVFTRASYKLHTTALSFWNGRLN